MKRRYTKEFKLVAAFANLNSVRALVSTQVGMNIELVHNLHHNKFPKMESRPIFKSQFIHGKKHRDKLLVYVIIYTIRSPSDKGKIYPLVSR